MTSLTDRGTAPSARAAAPAVAFPGQSAPSPTFAIGSRLPAAFPRFAAAGAAATAGQATELPDLSTAHEPAPGSGPLQEYAGNTTPSARVSENVAGPAQNAEVRHEMKMGSSVG